MAINTTPMFYKRLYMNSVNAGAVTACTTRAPTASASLAGANIISLVPTTGNTDGRNIERIVVKGSSTSITAPTAAMTVCIWRFDGTTAFLVDEIVVSVDTATAAGDASFFGSSTYDWLRLPTTDAIYYSLTATTTASTTALTITAIGGDY